LSAGRTGFGMEMAVEEEGGVAGAMLGSCELDLLRSSSRAVSDRVMRGSIAGRGMFCSGEGEGAGDGDARARGRERSSSWGGVNLKACARGST
jgi:hypothetical protein